MIIKGQDVDNIYLGDTLTDDGFRTRHFDFLLPTRRSGWPGRPSRRRSPMSTSSAAFAGRPGPWPLARGIGLGCRSRGC
jgi:type I restriction enzyme M protein